MEYYKGYTCVTVDELTSKDGGRAIMSLSNYKQLSSRKRINIVRKGGGLDSYVLIDFNTLPERFKVAFIEKVGDPNEILRAQAKSDTVLEDALARDYFAKPSLGLSDDKIEEYTMNASVLNEIIATIAKAKALRDSRGGGNSGKSVKEIILELAEELRLYPGHTLPASWARLNQKIREYKAMGYEALVQGYVGNNNAVKITEAMGRQIIALKRSKVPQYNNEQIFVEINRIALVKGWKPIKSINTLVNYLNSPEIEPLWYDAKLGSKAAKQKFARKHKTNLPLMRDALWYGDGTKLNLYYKAFDAKGKAIMRTIQVYEVMDAFSEVFLGYNICENENFEAQYIAYRMAVETAKCRPFEIVNDNQGGHRKARNAGFFDRIARINRPTAPYNGSSKTIESAFGRFQRQMLSRDWRFTGMNITTKGEFSRPDIEMIEANVDNLYTLQELKEEYITMRQCWNNAPHPETGRPRMEMYLESINPDAQPITVTDTVDMFWRCHEKPSTFTTSGITITIDKREYQYEVYGDDGYPDLGFRRNNTGRKFYVKYDPLNMREARLYIEDAQGSLKFVAEAAPYFEIHRAIQEQQPGEMEFIRNMDERIKQDQIEHYLEMVKLEVEHGVAPEQHGLNRPRIAGISSKQLETYMDKLVINGTTAYPTTVGQTTKMLSNLTHDQINGYDKF